MKGEYTIPKACEMCGSEDIVVRVLYDTGMTRYVCMDCGHSRSLPKAENLQRRTNTTINHWAQRIIAHHPFCSICGSKEDLEAHHIIPVANSRRFAYTDTNGITLCKRCHYLVHHKEEQ